MGVLGHILHNGMQYIAGLTAGAVLSVHFIPQTFGLSRYQTFLQLYDNGFEVKVDKHNQELVFEVFDDMALKEEDAARVNLFVAFGQEIIGKGSLHTRQGGILGIPANFKYQCADNVERNKVILNNKRVDWESQAGAQLADSLVLSDRAKKFAIAREVFGLKTYRYVLDGLLASVAVLGAYSVGFSVNQSLGLRAKVPRAVRGVIYTGIAALGCLTYVTMADAYSCRQDRKLDDRTGRLSREYAEGGVEYYTKLLQRNMALHQLLGSSGAKLYTPLGNATQSWRTPRLSLSAHRDLMVDMAKGYSNPLELDQNENTTAL